MSDAQGDQESDGLQFEEALEEESPEIRVAPEKRQIRTKSVDPEIVSLHDSGSAAG